MVRILPPTVHGSYVFRGSAEQNSWPGAAHGEASLTKLWWNFIGRSHEEIETARKDWMEGPRFGEVTGYDGARLPAPQIPPVALKPRGRVR